MANKRTEYYRGLNSGLQMAYRMMRDAGLKDAENLIGEEIRIRGVMQITPSVTKRELEDGCDEIEQRLYESFLCQTLIVLHDAFDFGKTRCLRFMDNWNLKADQLRESLVSWEDNVTWVRKVLGIDIQTTAMERGGILIREKLGLSEETILGGQDEKPM